MKKYISLALALMFAVSVAFVSVASASDKKAECKEGMGMDSHGKCVECKDGHDAHGNKCEESHMEKKAH